MYRWSLDRPVVQRYEGLGIYPFRACQCWDVYREGSCAHKISNYIGEHVNISKAKRNSFRYFLRTTKNGSDMGDTSSYANRRSDFVYNYDNTCDGPHSSIRKITK